jgi:cytochrome c oxidase assembly protein subunit 15
MSTKRTIFEDVGEKSTAAQQQIGLIDQGQNPGARAAIRAWMILLFLLVWAMILVGGLTRLTDSGLSITEWRPLTGALPPMSDAAWLIEFEKYKEIPEYQLQNMGMSMSEFKFIYWWEWGHRQLGRFIGLVWALGFVFFFVTKKIPTGWTPKLLLLGALGGLQGAIGWWMVHSGLGGEMLDVASYRLATHLGLAFVILGFITWFVLQISNSDKDLMQRRRGREAKLFSMSTGMMHFAFLQILIGALVAGIDAGRNYVDWPLMAGGFFPPFMFELEPVWRNFFENDGTVQFIHRIVAYILFIYVIVVWRRSRQSGNDKVRFVFNVVVTATLFQAVLGIVTVMYSSPLEIAIFHQFGAIVLWVSILWAKFVSGYPPEQSVRS